MTLALSEPELIDALEDIYAQLDTKHYDLASTLLSALLDQLSPIPGAEKTCTCGSTDGFHTEECLGD